jgi:hypothetical protein
MKTTNQENSDAFEESQRFNQLWLWGLLLCVVGFNIYSSFFGNEGGEIDKELLYSLIPLLVVCLLFVLLKLETHIDEKGISVRFLPFQRRWKSFNWAEIQHIEVRTYRPLMEYGGWGIRGLAGNKAYNVNGKIGIQVVFQNGNKLLIGTQKPDKASEAIKAFRKNA